MSEVLQLLANTDDAVCTIDGRQAIVQWNDAAERMFGRPASEVLGRSCFDVVRATDGRGCQVCRRGCLAVRLAQAGGMVPTRDLRVAVSSGAMADASVTTMVFPAGWRTIAALAHLFRVMAPDRVTDRGRGLPTETDVVDAFGLTRREREIVALFAGGAGTKAIGCALGISALTVKNHVHHVFQKLGVHNRLEAVARLSEPPSYLSGAGSRRSRRDPFGSGKRDHPIH